MLIVLLAITWLTLLALCVVLCRAAARGESQLRQALDAARRRSAAEGVLLLDESIVPLVRDRRPGAARAREAALL